MPWRRMPTPIARRLRNPSRRGTVARVSVVGGGDGSPAAVLEQHRRALGIADCDAMLQLQEEMNQRVHPAWRQQGYEWYRAIWVECAELLGHGSYQWWRDDPVNQVQLQLEVVDIWHFGLSALMERQSSSALAPWLERQFADVPPSAATADVVACTEALAADSLRRRDF